MQTISIAYSPDTDDAFMVQAMRTAQVDLAGLNFSYTSADIQELNEKARQGIYDVTAISIAAYPSIAEEYLMMPVGASIGDRFGPALIVKRASHLKQVQELRGLRIAVPGRQTSAFFAARGLIGDFEAVPMHFMQIGPAVELGDVDAGILIHELQINCEEGPLRKLGDLGSLWAAAFDLPLPLGANAIRRSLGEATIRQVTSIMRRSIQAGLANREATLKQALALSKADLDLSLGDRYISMYVNERSLRFEQDVREAMSRLFAIGEREGLCPPLDISACILEA